MTELRELILSDMIWISSILIYDESGNEYSEEEAISTAGEYTVEYRFKDPKSGWIKNTAKLEIEVITEEFTGNDIVVKNNTMSKGL